MLISEMIKQLEDIKAKHGDLPVRYVDHDCFCLREPSVQVGEDSYYTETDNVEAVKLSYD